MAVFKNPIAEEIWDMKYRLKHFDGTPVDHTVQDTWRRVAKALSSVEVNKEYWEEVFYKTLESFKFIPAGRINAGAGTDRNVTLFNCFVMGTIPDSLGGIFKQLSEAAITMQQGGGIGYDFSTIRPQGAEVKGVSSEASGPLTFMDVWDAACKTIMSAGVRRGAMMATMRCDHPDIEKFIDAKRDPNRLRMFNLSVLVTDGFMEAVENDENFDLVFEGKVYKTIRARSLWDKITLSTYHYAEPGVIFIDRINRDNNLKYMETIASCNPCGEQPLPPYGACLLGSINLVAMLHDDYSINEKALVDTVSVAVRMLDNVVDVSKFPLPAQQTEAYSKRRIGLGVTGLADVLALSGINYGSDEAVEFTNTIMEKIANIAYRTSALLANEKGVFPAYEPYLFQQSNFYNRLSEETKEYVQHYGLRNSHLLSVAPTGTISLYAGNVSSGIEPIFALEYDRHVLQKDGSKVTQTVQDYGVLKWNRENLTPLPSSFVTTADLVPEDHIRIQAAAQYWVDSSISKTINVPEDISFEDFKEVYTFAWRTGCKGCTTYRPNDVTGSVLSVKKEKEEFESAACELKYDENTGQMLRTCE